MGFRKLSVVLLQKGIFALLQYYVDCDMIYEVNSVIKKKEDSFSFGYMSVCLLEGLEKESQI